MSIFLRVQPLYFPADYTFRQTGVHAATKVLAVKCWVIVVVKKNRGKDDMEMVSIRLLLLYKQSPKNLRENDVSLSLSCLCD